MEHLFWLHTGIAFIVGLCFGSFLTLASWRLPRDEEIVKTPSRCPGCLARLGFRDLWPVLSWSLSKGRCRYCGVKVSVRYPVIELVTGLLFASLFAVYGPTIEGATFTALGFLLLLLIVIDLEHYLIPDGLQLLLLALGIFWKFYSEAEIGEVVTGLLAGVAIGATLLYGFKWVTGRDGLGMGDVKFLGVAGVWIGATALVPFLFYSGILGIMTALAWRALGQGKVFPFGPALALSLFLCVLFPDATVSFWHFGEWIAARVG